MNAAASRLAGRDGEVRWVGVEPPSGDDIAGQELMRDFYARKFADAAIDGGSQRDVDYAREGYLEHRERLALWQSIYDHMWSNAGRDGRFRGWLVTA